MVSILRYVYGETSSTQLGWLLQQTVIVVQKIFCYALYVRSYVWPLGSY